jgi:type IV secretion system protein VirB10
MPDATTHEPQTGISKAASPPTNAELTGATSATAARATDARELTDLHRTKVPADDPRLKLERPKSRTLRRGPALAAAALLATIFGIALIIALAPSGAPAADDSKKAPDVSTNTPVTLPDVLRDPPEPAPSNPHRSALTSAAPQAASLRDDPTSLAANPRSDAARQARLEEVQRARGASVFAAVDDSVAAEASADLRRQAAVDSTAASSRDTAGAGAPTDPSHAPDPNMQERKNDFLARAGVSSAEYLEKSVTLPRSPFELKAGTVIPTVLITGINSDLPGQVVGQVRENVYDTVSGNYLLIPQGSRVIAAYDSMVAWGQERVLVCWNRVIRPDGSSITLDCMPGVDLAGYAGFSDDVDNHWWRIISGAALSSLFAATAQASAGNVTTYQPSVTQAWAGNAAGQINQAGQQITARNLQIQPTITVRPGFSVNVLVSKDIVIPPYQAQGATR